MIDAVLLDVGGVVLDESDQERAIATAITETLRDVDPTYSIERYRASVARAIERHAPQVYRAAFWDVFAPDAGRCGEAFAAFRRRWRSHRPPLSLQIGIASELPRLAARFRVGLAGQYGAEILDLLDREGLGGCLAWRLTQDDLDVTKPDPRFYERIAAAIGVDPRACVMVGDRIDKDVVPARAVGMRTIRVRNGLHRSQEPRSDDEVPDLEIPSVVGLADAVGRLPGRLRPDR